jgi:TolB-like protein
LSNISLQATPFQARPVVPPFITGDFQRFIFQINEVDMKSQKIYSRGFVTILTLLLLLSLLYLSFNSAKSYAEEITISEAVKQFAQDKKRMRIAVLDFINTDEKKSRFDVFIADTIVSELSKYPVTLLERKRLEALLKEHELSQSGVVDSEKAVKLGMLLPVDVIVSGSYTSMQDKIIINGRFIHVGTGEILYAFTSSMNVAASTAIDQPDTQAQQNAEKAKCEKIQNDIRAKFEDLRSESLINNAVSSALKIPFNGECGNIHFFVISTLYRYKIYPPEYKSFLIATLDTIDNPTDDERAREIIRYFAYDGNIDSDEWKSGIEVIKKTRNYMLHIPIGYLLKSDSADRAIVKKRADEIMLLGIDKKIGRPVPSLPEDVLYTVISALKKEDKEAAVYIYKKYSNLMPDEDKYNKKISGLLESMYFDSYDSKTPYEKKSQKEILSILINFYKNKQSEVMAEECAGFLKTLESKTESAYEHDKEKINAYKEDIAIAGKSLENLFCISIGTAKKNGYRYIVDERIQYALKNRMKCEFAPAIKDLEADMRSGDWDKKLVAIELLSKIGASAAEAEETVIKYLGQQGYGSQGGKLRSLCAKTLGNINTSSPKGISMLIESFPDYDNGVSYEAEEAVKKIGLKAMPYLAQGLGHKEHAVRFRCAKALGNLGRNAKSTVPELKKIAEKDEDPYVRKEAQGAIQMIINDF